MSQMDQYKQQANEILDMIDQKLSVYPLVQQVSAKTTLRPSHLTVGALLFLCVFVFYGVGGRLVSNMVGFAYPLYQSFTSLKNKPQPGCVDDEDTQWLTYWVVYSTFTLIESASSLLELWIPAYYLVKIVFLLWAMLPQTKGALLIYGALIEPILARYEGRIDKTSARARSSLREVAGDIVGASEAAIESKKRELVDGAISSLLGGQQQAQQQAQACGQAQAHAVAQAAVPGGPDHSDHSKLL